MPTLFHRILFSVLLLIACPASRAGQADGKLDLYWIDAEGGGATLLVTPAGESVLIDTGNPGGRDATRIHHVATTVAGLTRIDHLITTHFHIDHYGGAAELAQLMPIGRVYDNGIPTTNPDNKPADTRWVLPVKSYATFAADSRHVLNPGDILPLRSPGTGLPLTLRCVAARQKFIAAPTTAQPNPLASAHTPQPPDSTDNANSIVLVLDFGPFRFFDGGDLTWNREADLVLPVNRIGQVDVYQVNHHGLPVSNNPVLIHSLAPRVSIMNNGATKGTAPATLAALRTSPGLQAQYQVHRNVRPGEEAGTADDYTANLPAKCDGNFIHLAVDPDGLHYTVSIPANGHRRTFTTRLDK